MGTQSSEGRHPPCPPAPPTCVLVPGAHARHTASLMAAHSIEIKVDGATFSRWATSLASLRYRRRVEVVGVDNVSGLPPLPGVLDFSGLKLLHDVGLASTKPHVLNDPSRLFAVLKYASSMSDQVPFALRGHVKEGDTHKKKVLSDELGAGFSFLFARRVLGATRFMDLWTARSSGLVRLSGKRSKEPDYVCHGSSPFDLKVLEAKGTQSSHSYSREQVRQGCKQVAACKIAAPGYSIGQRAAVGVSLSFAGNGASTRLNVADPPEEDAELLEFEGDPAEAISSGHFAGVALFAGDEEVADRLLHRDSNKTYAGERAQEEDGGRAFGGSRLVLRCGASAVSVFLGMDSGVRDMLLGGSARAASEEISKVSAALIASKKQHALSDVLVWGQPILWVEHGKAPPDDGRVPLEVGEQGEPAPEDHDSDLETPAATTADDGSFLKMAFEGPLVKDMKNEWLETKHRR